MNVEAIPGHVAGLTDNQLAAALTDQEVFMAAARAERVRRIRGKTTAERKDAVRESQARLRAGKQRYEVRGPHGKRGDQYRWTVVDTQDRDIAVDTCRMLCDAEGSARELNQINQKGGNT